ncbi:MAG: 3-alpha,7-alpha,12-alpha-trihydroxy-5-beta-cholest-24-enoyl-CoA hydratase [Betaproteobacteria bacterium HGW-Betaproteobacteria-5]|jgi:acyl dehydratase|nr:MAG: 3-alpha,7-alpha,12-alpha-trihydroxy-5-beta-cholest-24-enoyl-CoA hydratase [Betaproteobacteria bacterium HGW-Betaproteobacteria-5]PKO41156.1 MAG: 3-alpha,7-alpha,12-alpha-trihydroxy-5-beta-cholest-24-enoyl-CoA hydratase [Betaproteobacteria bacterium HGW-Betaproteobacteria-6]
MGSIDANRLKSWNFSEIVQTYSARDTMLYALTLGLGANPEDPRQLRYVYERNLIAFPTMATTLCFDGPWTVPGSGINLGQLLHGEQTITMHSPLPPAGTVRSRERITNLVDKGKDAIIYSCRELLNNETGSRIATLESAIFCRENGGFSSISKQNKRLTQPVPTRAPDSVVEIPTLPQTAIMYRLNGDYAKLHVDPNFASEAGFSRPIMHGLCTFGIAALAVLQGYADLDASRLKSFRVRFCAPAYPGETISVELWRDSELISFRAWAAERGIKVLDCGTAVLT